MAIGDRDPSLVFDDIRGWHMPDPPAPIIQTRGCICPQTSEQTCQNPLCPRKGVDFMKFGGT